MTIIPRGDRFGVKAWDAGTKRYRWVGTYATPEAAADAERLATLKPGRGMPTVAEWAQIWLADYPRSAPATRRTYGYAVRQIVAALGRQRLDSLNRPAARRLAQGWPRNTTRVARTMWGDAVRDGVCDINPWTNLRLETPKGRKDLDALTEQEVHGLAAIALSIHDDYGQEAAAVLLTLGFVGVRPGELCTLRTADVNLPDSELTVRYSIDGTGHEKAPKNGKPRVVTVPPSAAQALALLPQSMDGYVFHTRRGRRLSKSTLHYLWRPVAAAWREKGGRALQLYELRHAAATHFLERGSTPADVAVQLGHTDGGRLVQVLYGHPSEGAARDRLKMAFAQPERLPLKARRA